MIAARYTPVLAILVAVNVLNFVDRQLPFILAESIKRDLQLTDTQLGLLSGLAFALVYSVAALPMARLADLWSPRKALVVAVSLWSTMTALGSFAGNFMQMALTRTGVAIGEAGGTPSAHALIARGLPNALRGRAIGVFAMGAPIGTMLGLAVGGWIADVANWRTAMLAAGAVGGLIVLIAIVILPPTEQGSKVGTVRPTKLFSIRRLASISAFRSLFYAMCLIGMAGYPFLAFTAPYLIRVHGLSATQAGLFLGLINGGLGIAGTLGGGALFDREMRNVAPCPLRWPSFALLAAAPTSLAAYLMHDVMIALFLLIPTAFAITFYTAALYGSAHLIAGPGHEATATSALIIGAGIVGGLIGPVAVGGISDALAPALGVQSLRWGLVIIPVFTLCAGWALSRASRRVAAYLESQRFAGTQGA